MATSAKRAAKPATPAKTTSADLQGTLKRIKSSDLAAADKAVLADILTQSIKLKKLVEKATESHGGKKVIARLPGGFDIVK